MSDDQYGGDEELEYESDDEHIEMVYTESQSGKVDEVPLVDDVEFVEVEDELEEGLEEEEDPEEEPEENIPFVEEIPSYVGEVDNENTFKHEAEEQEYYEKQFEEEFKEELKSNNDVEEQTIVTEVIDDFSESEEEGEEGEEGDQEYENENNGELDVTNNALHIGQDSIFEDNNNSSDIDELKEMAKIPVYLDFSDLFGDKDNNSNKQLTYEKEQININFDFMKLFQPKCQEDELYSEFDSLFNELFECIELKFSEIFNRLKDLLNINLDIINIEIIFTDLNNFKIESDLNFSNEINFGDILKIFYNLRNQTPNGLELYKIFSIRIMLSRSNKEQFHVLNSLSMVEGTKLENLGDTIRKREGDYEVDSTNNKRIKSSVLM